MTTTHADSYNSRELLYNFQIWNGEGLAFELQQINSGDGNYSIIIFQ